MAVTDDLRALPTSVKVGVPLGALALYFFWRRYSSGASSTSGSAATGTASGAAPTDTSVPVATAAIQQALQTLQGDLVADQKRLASQTKADQGKLIKQGDTEAAKLRRDPLRPPVKGHRATPATTATRRATPKGAAVADALANTKSRPAQSTPSSPNVKAPRRLVTAGGRR